MILDMIMRVSVTITIVCVAILTLGLVVMSISAIIPWDRYDEERKINKSKRKLYATVKQLQRENAQLSEKLQKQKDIFYMRCTSCTHNCSRAIDGTICWECESGINDRYQYDSNIKG